MQEQLTYLNTQDIYINNLYRKLGFEKDVNLNQFLPIKFNLIDVSVANGLRRIFTSEIRTLAFSQYDENKVEKIFIKSNTSQYHRDVLIDRVGFITIDVDFIEQQEYDAQLLEFVIANESNSDMPLNNTTNSIIKITVHQHIIGYFDGKKLQQDTLKKICPFDSLIMTLKPNEEILITMKPTFGTGYQHPRWQSSCVMYKFGTELDLKIEYKMEDKLEDKPKDKPKVKVETNDEQMNYIGNKTKIPEFTIITIESIGKMSSYNVLMKGLLVLKNKLTSTKDKILSEQLKIEYDTNMPTMATFKIEHEDHTLGNILQFGCLVQLKTLIREKVEQLIQNGKIQEDASQVEQNDALFECLFGYRKTHPMENWIELIVRTPTRYNLDYQKDYVKLTPPIALVATAIDYLNTLCKKMIRDAGKFTS